MFSLDIGIKAFSKRHILQVKFHQYNLLCFLIERQGYSKQNANGIGMQMVQLPEEFVDTELETNTDGCITLPQVNIQSIVNGKKKKNICTQVHFLVHVGIKSLIIH